VHRDEASPRYQAPPKRLVPTLNEGELEALLSQPNTQTLLELRDHVFMLVLLDTGIRLSEALGLQVPDADIEGRTMKVLRKGDEERVAGFSPVLGRHLRRHMGRREEAVV